ncbi:hypothetical protein BDZ91DRAFT_451537 [Kalaharituber pfeilii]|nr:hypothetical protein BDZ91DRAFT_451537 [Kalaharituber pfeilii]
MSRPKFQSTIWVTGGRYHTSAADIILMSTFIALISIITLPAVVTAELLQFGPDALPHCAYDCVPLWSAQYECQMETVPGACFCKSSYLVPLLRGDGSSVCEAICPEGQGGAEVRSWFERVCVAFMGQPGNPQEDPSTGNPPKEDPNNPNDDPKNPDGDGGGKDSDTKNPGLDLGPNQAEKAIDWWKNN